MHEEILCDQCRCSVSIPISVSDSGIVMENTQKAEGKPQRMAHAPLSHSRSTVIGRTHPQEEPRLPRNLSDSHVQEPFGKY